MPKTKKEIRRRPHNGGRQQRCTVMRVPPASPRESLSLIDPWRVPAARLPALTPWPTYAVPGSPATISRRRSMR